MKETRETHFIPDSILHLLILKATGRLQEEDASKLNAWLHENPEAQSHCKAFADKAQKLWWTHLSETSSDPEELVKRIISKKLLKLRSRHSTFRYLAYAATLLILAGFAWYFLFYMTEEEPRIVTHETFVSERNNRALLVLSDGNSLVLDQAGNAGMLAESGVRITNLPGELLRYEQDETSFDELRLNRLIVPAGARYQLQLSDGTKVWMNSRSELEYPVTFSVHNRRVRLMGEAYFEVMQDASAPFIIEANGYEVVVLGTTLNISAYDDDNFIQTTLVSGALEVNNREGLAYKLNPGQMAMINHMDQQVTIENVDTRLFTSWREGILHFNKIPLKDLAIKLERWYNVEIHFSNAQTPGLLFSGAMENSRDIRFLLKLIGQAAKVEFEINENQITVK
mgnify:CR=1 FL=1